jgi:hypothetical protein
MLFKILNVKDFGKTILSYHGLESKGADNRACTNRLN